MNNFRETQILLETLNLNGISKVFENEINNAESSKSSYLSFLRNILKNEIKHRTERKLKRNLTAAHFPNEKHVENYNFDEVDGINELDFSNILDFMWLDNHQNILFFGPPGVGKTHLSIAIGLKAIHSGYRVLFEKLTNLVKLLKNKEIQRSAAFRVNSILKADLIIIDEIGYTPIDKREANLLFNLISELYEKSSVIVTSNKSFSLWTEMLDDEIMTAAMLDRLLHNAKIFKLDGPSHRLKNYK